MLAKIAEEMTRQSKWKVTAEQVTKIKEESENMVVYGAICGDVTILCWRHVSGTCKVKWVTW